MTLLLMLVLWFTVSLPAAVITGRALAVGRSRSGLPNAAERTETDQTGCQSGKASKTPDVFGWGSVPSARIVQIRY